MLQSVFHSAAERGFTNFGWLQARPSFSFGRWYHPEKLHFGALRVLNDDIIRGGTGFGQHPHDNMEIITIPLQGGLKHKDTTGGEGVILAGDVQVMSAGSGLEHSEMNASPTEEAHTLQIWIYPKTENIPPRYDQKTFGLDGRIHQWQVVVSGHSADLAAGAMWMNQDGRLSLSTLTSEGAITYTNRYQGNGVFFFVLSGQMNIEGHVLNDRDAVGLWGENSFQLQASVPAAVLAIEVPMYQLT